ncbi:molybdopterin-dependent oxidoreductase [Ilumatobacter sp.]|uniref:molybdopterin-dependent oxidoreductase n=1 Tax=Ilumatobacter sp. TaxID=1967498 RepID=UPI003B51AEDF
MNHDDRTDDEAAGSSRWAGGARDRDAAARERALREATDDGEIISADDHRRRSRRSFLAFAGLGALGAAGFHQLQNRPSDRRIPDLLRRGLNVNESVWTSLERSSASARTFSLDDREELRVNGRIGLDDEAPTPEYEIEVLGVGGRPIRSVAIDEVRALEPRQLVWEHKCIEGWSSIVSWTGTRFSDFVASFAPGEDDWEHVSLRTVDGAYYVGVDRFTMMHDQTLLAWRLNDDELTTLHGAPLRLATPLKYGIKQLKQVATIEFTRSVPDDYWTERGYDHHAGF